MNVLPQHFSDRLSPLQARALFTKSVYLVEIETFTYCNRVCWFCPNSRIDRRSHNNYMDEGLYLRILSELAQVNYERVISFSRYNEPLADRIILKRLKQARSALPKAHLLTHTNGDYLTLALLDELREAGLNQLRVQVYLGNEDHWDADAIVFKMQRRIDDLGLKYEMIDSEYGYAARLDYHYSKEFECIFEAQNFDLMGLDRGQTLDMPVKYTRTSPCRIVFDSLYIDWNGKTVPCCNIRSDEPSHQNYIVGDLSGGQTIFQAYVALFGWRKALAGWGEKANPCSTCSYAVEKHQPMELAS